MVEIANLDCSQSICQADVILKKPLKFEQSNEYFEILKIRNESSKPFFKSKVKIGAGFLVARKSYHLSLEVRDTNGEVTVVQSQLQPTPPLNAFVG